MIPTQSKCSGHRLFPEWVMLCAFVSLLWTGTGCRTLDTAPTAQNVSQPSTPGDQRAQSGLSTDLIRVGDIVQIVFSGVSDPPPDHEERIKEDGMINLPLLKTPVKAAGKTRRELEDEIRSLYVPRIYLRLTVTLKTEQRFFFVRGEVVAPNRHQYLGDMTLLKAIASAGDFTPFANKKKVEITRANGQKLRVNCVKAQANPEKFDVPIYPDDTIFVPRRLW